MIQRIQTIFLLLAGASFLSLFKLDFMDTPAEDTASMQFLADGAFNIQDHIIFLVLAALGAGISLIAVLLYKNRPLQLRLGYLLIVVALLIPLLGALLFYQEWAVIPDGTEIEVEYGVIPPILAIIFVIVANRFIKKDENLVQSMDRLR